IASVAVAAPRAGVPLATAAPPGSLALALVFVLWTYGGWNEHAYVAAEMKDPQRNIPRSLLLGTSVIALIYVVVNAAFVYGLGFETLVKYTAAVFWTFFFLTGLAVIVLRVREPARRRPYRVPGYPLTPLAFCASSAYMIYGSVSYAPFESVAGVAIVLTGI